MIKRAFHFLVLFCLFGYATFCLFVYKNQREIQYSPVALRFTPEQAGLSGVEFARVVTADGIALEGWYVPAKNDQKTIVFFHGNGQIIGSSVVGVSSFITQGYGILFAEYRGYAGHRGEVTEQGLYQDAFAFVRWLHEQKNVVFSDMIMYGDSLGTSLALRMAAQYDVAGVVLLASYSSILDVAEGLYWYLPIRFLLKDTYRNDVMIKAVNEPVLMFHGQKDKIIPFKYGHKLYESSDGWVDFISVGQGTHNNLYEFGITKPIQEFMDNL